VRAGKKKEMGRCPDLVCPSYRKEKDGGGEKKAGGIDVVSFRLRERVREEDTVFFQGENQKRGHLRAPKKKRFPQQVQEEKKGERGGFGWNFICLGRTTTNERGLPLERSKKRKGEGPERDGPKR